VTENEKRLLDGFLETLSDKMSVAGCNDFVLEDTEENRAIYREGYDGEEPVANDLGEIFCLDFIILGVLRKRLANAD